MSIDLTADKTTADGKRIVSIWPTEGSRKTVITANWADKTTWYYSATHTSDDVATPGKLQSN